ncbi:MAG TPA: phosphoadenylyl-sulfate reductase [Bacteroidales bacterium]|nr:phosphoadenylyl-sulfate reductase [Bacteroidales bacterium]
MQSISPQLANELNKKYSNKDTLTIIKEIAIEFKGKIVFSTSFSVEDQVITDMIANVDKSIIIFTIDTGRLFQETYNIMETTMDKYGIEIKTFFPDYKLVENMVNEKGINLFYYSVDNRKLCCNVRKKEPLKRALAGMHIWFTGLRKEQSITRHNINVIEWEDRYKLIKVNPLADWRETEVWSYIKDKNVPFNSLYRKGYRSIGCSPCTRATYPGEDIRAGRWWWEAADNKECGLHIND